MADIPVTEPGPIEAPFPWESDQTVWRATAEALCRYTEDDFDAWAVEKAEAVRDDGRDPDCDGGVDMRRQRLPDRPGARDSGLGRTERTADAYSG